ncbi:MAG: hypothetical protein ACHQQR_03390 [Gemmatimonadales bacterium]
MKTSRLIAALLGVLLFPAPALAQSVLGAGEDALVLPRGTVRFRLLSEWTQWFERYGRGTPGRKDGSVEPLGLDFNLDSIGASQFENIGPVQANIRTLAGMPNFNASLGKSALGLSDQIVSTPLAIEFGLTNRVSLTVTVPLVTATAHADWRVNPTGLEPTIGFNPTLGATSALAAIAAIAANAALLAQFDSAASQLNQRLAFCGSNPAATGCGSVNANRAGALALIGNANTFATGLGQLYGGRNGSTGAFFVPISGSAAEAAIEAKVAAYRALYSAFGATAIVGTGPVAAQTMAIGDMQQLLTDSTFGVRARPLATSVTHGIGDIDFALKVNLFDSFHGDTKRRFAPKGFNWRQSVGGVFRLGTGRLDAPDNFIDLGTGDHQNDVEIRSWTDLLYGSHFWMSLVARYNVQMADERVMRITDSPHQPIAAAYRQETVKRDLGDEFNLEVTPRWALNDYVGLAGQYSYRRKFSDAYTGRFTVTNLVGEQIAIDAATLDLNTEAREHRLGLGVTYSTVAAFEQKKTRVPVEITYFHTQTTLGSGGSVPKMTLDRVEVRWYWRVFGR